LAIFFIGQWTHGVHVPRQLAMQDVDIIAFSAHGSKAHPPPLHHWDEKKIASAGNRTRVTSMGNDVFYH
jgi:hypothetical protein